MKEKNLTEKESLELITEMIANTKKRFGLDRGKSLLVWGYTTTCAAILVYVTLMFTGSVKAMLWWALIPLAGWPLQYKVLGSLKQAQGEAKSFIDTASNRLWLLISMSELIAFFICLGFHLYGLNVWIIMFFFSLIIVGSAAVAQGILIRETSLTAGGLFSIAAGLFICAVAGSHSQLNLSWMMPLFIVSFAMMTIVPGHIINYKANKVLCSKN